MHGSVVWRTCEFVSKRGERSRRSGDQWRWSTETRCEEPPSQSRGVPGQLLGSVKQHQLGGGFPAQVFRVAELSPPRKGRFRQVARHALEARSHAVRIQDRRGEVRGWKLFCLMPMMFFRRSSSDGKVSKEEMCHRFNLFTSGEWGGYGKKPSPQSVHSFPNVTHGNR